MSHLESQPDMKTFENQSINYESKNKEVQLNCHLEDWYPDNAISIKWHNGDIVVNETKASECIIGVTNASDTYWCLIHHSKLNVSWKGTWQKKVINCTKSNKAGSNLCETINPNLYIAWLTENNILEPVMATSSFSNVKEHFKLCINASGEPCFECDLHSNITEEIGEYICSFKTTHSMHIIIMDVNFQDGTSVNHLMWLLCLLLIPVAGFGVLRTIIIKILERTSILNIHGN
ncbi:uncharacterized protein LOC134568780 [Pelobates fuscus]|uniref:uncharacterized protein LOC134568780 n=1 Tax=Pelobates fuscus TaxID=191477 RepID=UPI002FE48028